MKIKFTISLIVASVLLYSCQTSVPASNTTNTNNQTSFKGYELYTWKDNDKQVFALLMGTNRNKNLNEIVDAKTDFESIKSSLSKLNKGEYVSLVFAGMHQSLPPANLTAEMEAELKKVASEKGLELNLTTSNPLPEPAVETVWKKVEVSNSINKFSFFVPPDFEEVEVKPIDSVVKQYKNYNTILNLDYGGFSDPLDSYKAESEYQENSITIANKNARIISYKKDTKYTSAINFPDLGSGLKLTIYIESSDSQIKNTAKKIFDSIKF